MNEFDPAFFYERGIHPCSIVTSWEEDGMIADDFVELLDMFHDAVFGPYFEMSPGETSPESPNYIPRTLWFVYPALIRQYILDYTISMRVLKLIQPTIPFDERIFDGIRSFFDRLIDSGDDETTVDDALREFGIFEERILVLHVWERTRPALPTKTKKTSPPTEAQYNAVRSAWDELSLNGNQPKRVAVRKICADHGVTLSNEAYKEIVAVLKTRPSGPHGP